MQLNPDEVKLVKFLTAHAGRKLTLAPSVKASVESLNRRMIMHTLGLED
jgi:hypothetical protein